MIPIFVPNQQKTDNIFNNHLQLSPYENVKVITWNFAFNLPLSQVGQFFPLPPRLFHRLMMQSIHWQFVIKVVAFWVTKITIGFHVWNLWETLNALPLAVFQSLLGYFRKTPKLKTNSVDVYVLFIAHCTRASNFYLNSKLDF